MPNLHFCNNYFLLNNLLLHVVAEERKFTHTFLAKIIEKKAKQYLHINNPIIFTTDSY